MASRGFIVVLVGAIALIVIALLASNLLMPEPEEDAWAVDEPTEPAEPQEPEPEVVARTAQRDSGPTPEPEPEPPAVEHAGHHDFFEGEAPELITRNHVQVLDGRTIDSRQTRLVYDFGQANPKDARPQLLLAWDAMNREWHGMASRLYRMAFKADSRVKEDPRVLEDLLFVVGRYGRSEHREAVEIIDLIYDEEALPAIDAAMVEARDRGDGIALERLQKARDAVAPK